MPVFGRLQTNDGAEQHGLAGARAAHHAEDFATADGEVEILVDDLLTEGVAQPPDGDDRMATIGNRRWIELLRNGLTVETLIDLIAARLELNGLLGNILEVGPLS